MSTPFLRFPVLPLALRTPRLTLSVPSAFDVVAIAAACAEPDIQQWTSVPTPYGLDDAAAFVGWSQDAWAGGNACTWAVREGDALVGMIGLDRIDGNGAELGYWTAAAARGRGVTVEAATEVLDFAFDPQGAGLARVEWNALVGNLASARTAQRIGFRYEGTRRRAVAGSDGWVAGLLATDDRSPVEWPVLH